MRRILSVLLILGGVSAGSWFAAEPPTHIVVMHTNDLHGQLLPRDGFGGIAQIATIIRNAKPDLIVDAGDIFTGTFLADEFKGAPIIQAMNKIRYDAGTIGNHEFDYGQSALRSRLHEAKFPFLSANLQTPISEIKKYTIVNARGIRFGLIGLTTELVKTQSHPKQVVGVTLLDTVRALERLLPEVRTKCDFVIAVVHLDDDEEKRIASAFPEIRLIIGGHNHDALGPFWVDRTLVAKTGVAGHNVGRVDLEFQDKKLSHMEARLIPVKDVRPDPDVTKILEPFNNRVKLKMAEVIGEATDDLTYSRMAESPLADMVADALRETGKTQIALQNIGGIRANMKKGKITWGNAFEVLPFQNTLVTLELTGAQIKKTLEHGLVRTVGIPALSGLRIRFDLTRPSGQRVLSATLGDGTVVEDSRLYSVSTNDFLVAGGDGYTEFAEGGDIMDSGIILRDALVDYIKVRHTISPKIDGRMVIN